MKIELLYFDGCPNWQVADQRLREVLAGSGLDDEIRYHKVETQEEADRRAFRSSPTILIDGTDPFGDENAPVGLSCRVYQTEQGFAGAPSPQQLTAAIREHRNEH